MNDFPELPPNYYWHSDDRSSFEIQTTLPVKFGFCRQDKWGYFIIAHSFFFDGDNMWYTRYWYQEPDKAWVDGIPIATKEDAAALMAQWVWSGVIDLNASPRTV